MSSRKWLKGEIVRNYLKREGRSQKWLANKVGVSQYSFSGYMTGRRDVSRPVLILLSQFVGVAIDELTDEKRGEDAA